MTHSAPSWRTADATESSSVAMTTASATFIWEILCQTRTMRGSPERRRSGLRGRRTAQSRAGITTSVPNYPAVFARHDVKVTLSNIPTGDTRSKLISRSKRERNSERKHRFAGERRAILGWIDGVVDPKQARPDANPEILDQGRKTSHSGAARGIPESDKWGSH